MHTPQSVKERTSWDSIKSSTSDKTQGPTKRKPLKLSHQNRQFVPGKNDANGDSFDLFTPQKLVSAYYIH